LSIKIIGTGHILKRSVNEVKDVIEKTKPEIVALELDEKRLHALLSKYRQDSRVMGKEGKEDAIRGRGGSLPLFTKFLFSPKEMVGFILSKIQEELGKKFGVSPGSEMLQAIEIASSVGSEIVLIDRDIEITMNHLLAIPMREKIRILRLRKVNKNIFGKLINSDIEGLVDDEVVESIMREMEGEFPCLYNAVVDERDKFMAYNLFQIQSYQPEKNIVAVIGAGHKKGVERYLNEIIISEGEKTAHFEEEVMKIMKKKQTSFLDALFLFFIVFLAFILLKFELISLFNFFNFNRKRGRKRIRRE
jgi:pheromone shutdown-related protein TraB